MKSRVTLLCLLAILIHPSLVQAAYFQGLGDLPGGSFSSSAYGVSADGSVVVGNSHSASGYEAFRWTSGGGMIGLGDLPGGIFSSVAYDVSADGSVVVGSSVGGPNASTNIDKDFLWTSGGGMTQLGISLDSEPSISDDGSTVATGGWCGGSFPGHSTACLWTSGNGVTSLGYLPGTEYSTSYGISADGSTVVGWSWGNVIHEAFRWTSEGGMVGLGDLAGGSFYSIPYGVSADGSTVVGFGVTGSGIEAFRWTSSDGMVGLGSFTPGSASYAQDVSPDGSVIVGDSSGQAFIWDATHGMYRLSQALADYDIDVTGWQLSSATSITSSAGGLTIVGSGINPSGFTEAWIANIPAVPEPSTALLVGAGLLGLAVRRRKVA